MKRIELSQMVAKKLDLDVNLVDIVIKNALSTIKRTVKEDKLVDLENFGQFIPIFHDTWSHSSYDDWCKVNHIAHMPGVLGYAPDQWFHMEFKPTKDWRTWGEVDIGFNGYDFEGDEG